jgi:hypothetical protein
MRDTHRQHYIIEEIRGDNRTTPTLLGLLPETKTTNIDTQPTAILLEIGRLITPPDASDVRNPKKTPKIHSKQPDPMRATHASYTGESAKKHYKNKHHTPH